MARGRSIAVVIPAVLGLCGCTAPLSAADPFPADLPPKVVAELGEVSGLAWNPERQLLLAVTDDGVLHTLRDDGERLGHWSGLGDLEGVTLIDPASERVYLLRERPTNAIIEFDIGRGQVVRTFDLQRWIDPDDANSGAEGVAWVPGSDGGLFYVGTQEGEIYSFALRRSGEARVEMVGVHRPHKEWTDIAGLEFDLESRILYVLWDKQDRLTAYDLDWRQVGDWAMYRDRKPRQEGIAIDKANGRLFSGEDDSSEVYRFTGFSPEKAPSGEN